MKILVPVKRVVDYNVKVRVKSDGSGVDIANVKMSMNPFDEIAVEEAVRLREKGAATEIVAVSCGVSQCQETLRTAMAIGADRGILVETNEELQPLAVAKLLKALIDKEQPGLVILGKQAIDDDCNQTGQMLAALAGLPPPSPQGRARRRQGSRDPRSGRRPGNPQPHAARGHHRRPAPERTALRHLAQHHEGQEKPLDTIKPEDLGVQVAPRLKTLKVTEPAKRGAGVKVADVAALVENSRTKRR